MRESLDVTVRGGEVNERERERERERVRETTSITKRRTIYE